MKKSLTILYLFSFFICLSQNSGQIKLNWVVNSKISYETFEFSAPHFQQENFQFDLSKKQIFCQVQINNTGFVNENSLVISNLEYENISLNEIGDLNLNNISTEINAKLLNSQDREEVSALIIVSPVIKDGTSYRKLISFDYSFTLGNLDRRSVNRASISSSVLATGDWYRFFVKSSGAYIINKSFLQQLGINTSSFDPRNLKIYGNGGRMLPLLNSEYYPDDLTENAILVNGENDGVFNDNDNIIFYAEGLDNWNTENKTFGNLYDDKSYYYINIQGNAGKRINPMPQPTPSSSITFTDFDDTTFYETDQVNIGRLGRRWFGESFNIKNEQTFNFNIPNVVAASQMNIEVFGAARSFVATNFKVNVNGTEIGTLNPSIIGSNDSNLFYESIFNGVLPANDNIALKITYNNGGVPTSEGYLDYISIRSKRNLAGYGKQFRFQNNLSATGSGVVTYQFSNANNINQVWNITDIYNVSNIVNSNTANFSFTANLGSLQKYIAIDFNNLYAPLKDNNTKIGNQDLKGTIFNDSQGNFKDIDYLIITPTSLYSQAESLANFHRNHSGMNVKTVFLESIYQEFSAGKQDIGAIRNFVKYVYNNASTPSNKVKYLNLFGDASYDFKNRIRNNTNIVPIYHSIDSNSLAETSFASDDYFGMMDDNEGNLNGNYGRADIAVGRMIVSTAQQAEQMVNKVIEYHDIKAYGNWRNNYVFVADDPSPFATGDNQLQFFQNRLADKVLAEKPFLNTDKILLDSYVQEASAGGFRYPQAREDFFNAFAKGALVVNYLGHGGEDGLTQERVWEKSDGQTLANRYKYPLFVTLTCDFSRFDNPLRQTAGEFTYWNPSGGAIAMITTVREIGQGTAQIFNDTFASKLLAYGSTNYPSIGEALRLAKNVSIGSGKVIFCIGDPALMLAIPKPKVVLTKINDMPISGQIDDLKSLGFVKISGEIQDENSIPITNYDGDLSINIFDKNMPRTTLRNDFYDAYPSGTNMPFITLGETIFRGNASVNAGKFEFGFVVPRDIRIPVGNGRISFYAKKNQALLDQTGVDTNIKIGGVNLLAPTDNTPPTARLYMNDETFVNGGITNESPIFLAFLDDENGINTASGIGHDIVAILDGKITSPYILNDYYETELDNYKKGKIRFNFKNLPLGLHTLTFKAWDVYNNLVTAEIQFIVVGDETLTLTNVLNYPNPFVNYTQFWFTHNRPFEPLEVQVQILTITGKIIWTKNETVNTTGFLSRDISWDGRDDFGDKIGKGVYVYKLTVKSVLTDSTTEKYEKLVIL